MALYLSLATFILFLSAPWTGRSLQLARDEPWQNTEMTLIHVDSEVARQRGAVCLDGQTTPNFYWDPSPQASTKFILLFKGGGWCQDEDSCAHRFINTFQPKLVPDKAMRAFYQGPKWSSYNFVQLNYCDGAFFLGDKEEVENGLHFRGRRVLDMILDTLFQEYGLAAATDVLLTGTSSGGMATFLNADYVRARFAESVNFRAVPFSGFFLPVGEYTNMFQRIYELHGVEKQLPTSCTEKMPAEDRWQCLFPINTYPETKTLMFPVQSAIDGYQVQHFNTSRENVRCMIGGLKQYTKKDCSGVEIDSLNQIQHKFVRGFKKTKKYGGKGEGGFVISCPEHNVMVTMFAEVKIDDTTIEDAILDWLKADAEAPPKWYLPCKLNSKPKPAFQCNPTCKDAILGAAVA